MTDRIEIYGISGWGHHGVLDSERESGQEFSVDIVIGLQLTGLGDDLAHTVDYSVVAERAHTILVGEPVDLIETVAERIIDSCRDFSGISSVEVAVHKPSAPITVPFRDVVVRIRREFT
jgi:dihydroneopterin aldolase